MSKIIIHNESSVSDYEAIDYVRVVVGLGFMSGEKQYCWHTGFSETGISIVALKTRGNTHTFKVLDSE